MENGEPVVVVVRGAEGELGRYERGGGGGGEGPRWTCSYHAVNGQSDSRRAATPAVTPQPGQYVSFVCMDPAGLPARPARLFVFREGDDLLGGLFAAERAAELAREQLVVAPPDLRLNPPDLQVVGVPTWLAVDGGWGPLQASATVGVVTATVTATPTTVAWDLGDGARVTCDGPGTRFDPTRPVADQASGCTHTYTWPSHAQPGGTYRVSATTTWAVSWSATTGAGGDLGTITRTASMPTRVIEIQAVGH